MRFIRISPEKGTAEAAGDTDVCSVNPSNEFYENHDGTTEQRKSGVVSGVATRELLGFS